MKRRTRQPTADDRRKAGIGWGWVLAILAVALAYRGLCYAVVGGHSLFRHPVVDAGYHDAWARRMAAGDWLGHGPDDVFKPPLYAGFLAAVYSVFGGHVALVQWMQYLMGAASCVLVAVLAGRLAGPAAGRLAGFLSAAYAPYVFFESQLLTPALGTVLNLAALVVLVVPWRWPGYRRLAAAGALVGLSAGVRPDVLLPAALVFVCVLFHHRGRARRELAAGALCFAAAAAGLILPVCLRNCYLTGQFIPVSSNAGINFYVGNARGADGVTAMPVGLRWERTVARVPQEVLERPATGSRWWRRAAWREIQAAPGEALARVGRKALAFWNRREFRNNICYHFMGRVAWPLRLSPLQFAVVLPLGVCGLICLWRGATAGERLACGLSVSWIAGYWVVGTVFFVTARFRLPAVPLLMLPAACGTLSLIGSVRRSQWRRVAGYAIVVLGVGAVSWPMWLGGPRDGWVRDHVNLGNSRRNAGDLSGAQRAYREALEALPADPDAHYLLGLCLLRARPADALEHFRAAQAVLPDSPDLLFGAAQAHVALGHRPAARQALGSLLRLADDSNLWPKRATWAKAHILLADIEPGQASAHWEKAWSIDRRTAAEASFLTRRDLPRALEAFQAEARKQPWDWYAHANCGTVLLALGRADDAVAAYRQAVRRAPDRGPLRFHLARALLRTGRRDEAARLLDQLHNELPPCPLRRAAGELRDRTRSPTRRTAEHDS